MIKEPEIPLPLQLHSCNITNLKCPLPNASSSSTAARQCKMLCPKTTCTKDNATVVDNCKDQPVEYWKKELKLTKKDQADILKGVWISDKHVCAINKLLLAHFPKQNGLQDPLALAECLTYNSQNQRFIQIINVSRNHWVCVGNTLAPPGTVEVYDSIPCMSMNSINLHKQIAAIMNTDNEMIRINHIDVQRQTGSNDCGLFAMAFAVTLCMNGDPHLFMYNQLGMRSHLYECFETSYISQFPPPPSHTRRTNRKRILHTYNLRVYCSCRLPWDKYDHKKGPLVQCAVCKQWYHKRCLNIESIVITNAAKKYTCTNCAT